MNNEHCDNIIRLSSNFLSIFSRSHMTKLNDIYGSLLRSLLFSHALYSLPKNRALKYRILDTTLSLSLFLSLFL